MKIELELPDWCDERHLYIMAGIELVAYKECGKKWHLKTIRCNQCGKCCMNLVDNGQYQLDENKNCIHLEPNGPDKWLCGLGSMRPLPCGEGDPEKGQWNTGFCCIRYDGDI